MAEGTFCRKTAAEFPLPAPKTVRRGGEKGKHVQDMGSLSPTHAPVRYRESFQSYGGSHDGSMTGAGLLKGMTGKRL